MCVHLMVCFFFFKQKSAYELRISDWSSDVCSSDLGQPLSHVQAGAFCKFHQLRICLAEEFDREACKAVAQQEYADELAGLIARARLPEGNPKHQTKQDALQSRLIQLAGMTRHRAAAGKDDSPGHISRLAPLFAIYEIGQPPRLGPAAPAGAHNSSEEHTSEL